MKKTILLFCGAETTDAPVKVDNTSQVALYNPPQMNNLS